MSIVDFYAGPLAERYGYSYQQAIHWVRQQQTMGAERRPHVDRAAHMAWQRRELARLTVEAAVLEGEAGHGRAERFRRIHKAASPVQVRAVGAAKGITGYASVFNVRSNIGGMFEEELRPGAFDHVLDSDVVALFNHDPNIVLGRTPNTLKLSSDNHGLRFEIPELPSARADVLEAVRRGDIRGNSFSFDLDPAAGGEQEFVHRSEGIPLRIIHKVGRLYDVGPVTWPQYPETTVGARQEVTHDRTR